MTLKRIGLLSLVACILGAAFATTAFAEGEFDESATSAWYTGASPGTKLAEGATKSLRTTATETITLRSKFIFGSQLKLMASGLKCPSCVIKNVGSTAEIVGSLQFTGVKLIEPEAERCSVSSTIETKALTAVVRMRRGSTTVGTLKFSREGSTWFTIEMTGEKCSNRGIYSFGGTVFAESLNPTGVFANSQSWKFSEAIQKAAGSAESLNFYLEGSIKGSLEPELQFTTKEK